MLTNYVYLLREREFIKSNEEIYKIGKTTKPNHTRFNQYPKGSVLMFQIMCNDCSITEKNIISIFKTVFNHRKDIGSEYFDGDYTEMMAVMYSVVSTNWKHDIIEPAIIQQNYKCDICNKGFNSKQSYNLHINNPNIHIKPRKNIDEYIFHCSCGKKYLHQSSLSKHKKLCSRK